MKTFRSIRITEKKNDVVLSTKINNIPVKIMSEKGLFVTYIDGDKLDAYKSQKEAEKMAKEFIKQYKG